MENRTARHYAADVSTYPLSRSVTNRLFGCVKALPVARAFIPVDTTRVQVIGGNRRFSIGATDFSRICSPVDEVVSEALEEVNIGVAFLNLPVETPRDFVGLANKPTADVAALVSR